VICEQINNGLKAPLDVISALRRARINVVKDFRKLPQRWKANSAQATT
jgi:hypothetical protein